MRRIASAVLPVVLAVSLIGVPQPAAAEPRTHEDCISTTTRIEEEWVNTGNGPVYKFGELIEYIGSAARPPGGSYRIWHVSVRSINAGPYHYESGYATWCSPYGEKLGQTDLTRPTVITDTHRCGTENFFDFVNGYTTYYTFVGSRWTDGQPFRYWGIRVETPSAAVFFGVDAAHCA